jgi:hypothetical protein
MKQIIALLLFLAPAAAESQDVETATGTKATGEINLTCVGRGSAERDGAAEGDVVREVTFDLAVNTETKTLQSNLPTGSFVGVKRPKDGIVVSNSAEITPKLIAATFQGTGQQKYRASTSLGENEKAAARAEVILQINRLTGSFSWGIYSGKCDKVENTAPKF